MQGKAPDWQDFVGIITLLVINSTISFIEENNAGNAAAALMARLAPKAKVSTLSFFCFISILPGCVDSIFLLVQFASERNFVFLFPFIVSFLINVFVKVLRDGRWNEQDAAVLVPGDIISIKLGDIIPADARLLEGDPLKIDQVGYLFIIFIIIFKYLSHTICSLNPPHA